VTMNVVNPDSTIHIEEFAIQSDLMTTDNGSIVLATQNGSITIHDGQAPDSSIGISADGTGNILIQAQGEDQNITFDANVISDKGNISIIASDSINQKGDISTSGGTIDLETTTGSIIMDDGTTTAGTENIRYNAKIDLSLGVISTTADVSLLAESIIDSGNAEIDIIADALRIFTTGTDDGDGAGTSSNHIETNINKMAADVHGTNSGGLFITETKTITIDQLNVMAVNRVIDNSTTNSENTTDLSLSDISSEGHVVLITNDGRIKINEGDTDDQGIVATNNIFIQSAGISDIYLNADINSKKGNISIHAGQDIIQNADISTDLFLKTIDLLANRHIRMTSDTTTTTTDGNIQLDSNTGNITLEFLDAGAGNVRIISKAGDIIDLDMDGDKEVDIQSSGLILRAHKGIGNGNNHIETGVDILTASAGSNGIFITENNGITIDSQTINIDRVDATAKDNLTNNISQADLTTISSGNIVLVAGDTITINEGGDLNNKALYAGDAGNILLKTMTNDIHINDSATIFSDTGHITIVAANNINQLVNVNISTTNGSIDLKALSGAITMNDHSMINTEKENIRLLADGDIQLGGLNAGIGNVSITSLNGSILDNGNAYKDIKAFALRMNAGAGIGTLGSETDDAIDISVYKLTAHAGNGGINILEDDDIKINTINVSVNHVENDGQTTRETDVNQTDIITSDNGAIILQTVNGTMTVYDGKSVHADGTGNILLKASGSDKDIILSPNADILSGTGNITLIAQNNISQSTKTEIQTKTGDIYIKAVDGTITMDDKAITFTGKNTGDINYFANSDITLGGIHAGTGNVNLYSQTGSILDSGDTYKDIQAASLRMGALISIGELYTPNPLDIAVDTITATTGKGGISLFENDDIVLSDVAVTMNVVNPDSTIHIEEFAIQSDLMTSENGSIVLTTQDGSISIHDGFAPDDGVGINADGIGNILIQAQGEDHNITFDANIISDKGNISIIASDSINQKADISTSGGTIDLEATTGSIIMDDGTTTFGTENIRYNAKTDLSLGVISTTADVSLLAESIIDSGNAEIDIIADALRIITTGTNDGDGAGFSSNHIETNINLLAADIHGTNSGGLFITETNAITIDQLNAIAVNRVANNATISSENTTDIALSDIDSDGQLVLITTEGNI
ncbi:parallel beta-helix repeat-containing protein, partial [Candidatus Magnetomorum sp. HK-1]